MPRLKAAFGGLGFREPEVRGPATKEPRHLGDVRRLFVGGKWPQIIPELGTSEGVFMGLGVNGLGFRSLGFRS